MSIYSDYINQRTAWVTPRMTTPWPGWGTGAMGDPDPGYNAAINAYRDEEKALGDQWFEQLPDAQKSDVAAHFKGKADSTAKINKWGELAAKGIIGAAAGGAALGAMGGAGAAGTGGADAATSAAWSSGAGLGGDTLSAMGMAPAVGDAATAAAWGSGAGLGGDTLSAMGMGPIGDAATSAAWGSGAGLGGDTLSAMGAAAPAASGIASGSSGGGLLSGLGSVGSAAGSLVDWASKNPGLVSLLGGLLSGAGAASNQQTTAPAKSYAPQPGLTMGTLQQPTMNQSAGLLTSMQQRPMLGGSGLARFGATGGLFTPSAYTPTQFKWGAR